MVAALSSYGARVVVAGERVKLVWTDGREPPGELITATREAKAELRDFFSRAATTHGKPAAADAAANNGDTPSKWSNGFARLDRARPPDDVPQRRWHQFISDCGTFLDGGWPAKAVALGWGPLDLFGCNRDKPFARIDHMGLLWLLNGRKLVALTADSAVIGTPSGVTLTFRRKPTDPGVVVAWEAVT